MNDDNFLNDDDLLVNDQEEFGENDASGSTADLESDDNALDAAQSMGLYKNADEEHPVELGLGDQINEADEEDLEAA